MINLISFPNLIYIFKLIDHQKNTTTMYVLVCSIEKYSIKFNSIYLIIKFTKSKSLFILFFSKSKQVSRFLHTKKNTKHVADV